MGDFDEFDAYVEQWREQHPDESVPLAELFAQYLADVTGNAIVGRQVNGDGIVVAISEERQ